MRRRMSGSEPVRSRSRLKWSRCSFLEVLIECIEALAATPQEFFIAQAVLGPAFQHPVNADTLDRLKLSVLQVGVVHHPCDLQNGLVGDMETLQQRLKRAVVAVVGEFRLIHIVRDGAGMPGRIAVENETGFGIDELTDEPR